ncbi:MAG TPA: HAMP domain-containing sensor histidine kinase [Chthoniobacteraceae bacterium]|nr:HAMP domain-containing sensor histidine kinase [Chthoniobacteraceae bacterium]
MKRFLHSIRWQVQVWYGLILLATLVAFCFTAYRLAWDHQMRGVDRELGESERRLIRSLVRAAHPPGDHDKEFVPMPRNEWMRQLREGKIAVSTETMQGFEGAGEPGGAYFALYESDGFLLAKSPGVPEGVARRFLPVPERGSNEALRSEGKRRELYRSTSYGMQGVVGRNIEPELELMRRFAWSLSAAGGAVWLLGLLGGWWLAGRAIRPIELISRTAARIAEGNLQERIAIARPGNELDDLSRVLNRTFERLHDAFERQKQFTADASHELRTPVTVLLSETQRILKRERTPEEYREALETCEMTGRRMRGLIEALLLLARHERGGALPESQGAGDLVQVVRDTLDHLAPLADEAGVTLRGELPSQPAWCTADAGALGVVVANLVLNAIRHPGPGTEVRVAVEPEAEAVQLTVSDNGVGIAPEELPHLFERFYRVDKARTGDGAGHTGLGLAIVQRIVENHGGSVTVASEPGQGACFGVRLPRSSTAGAVPS